MAGDNDVCRKRINRVVPVSIMADFHAAKDISSDLALSNDVVDIPDWYYWVVINLMTVIQLPYYILYLEMCYRH
jgi:hypothetical protein